MAAGMVVGMAAGMAAECPPVSTTTVAISMLGLSKSGAEGGGCFHSMTSSVASTLQALLSSSIRRGSGELVTPYCSSRSSRSLHCTGFPMMAGQLVSAEDQPQPWQQRERIRLLANLHEYEIGLVPGSLSLEFPSGYLDQSPSPKSRDSLKPQPLTLASTTDMPFALPRNIFQQPSHHPLIIKLCLLEGVWCTVQLVASGFKLDSAEPISPPISSVSELGLSRPVQPPGQTIYEQVGKHVAMIFESMDSLLNTISPKYRDCFHEHLSRRLQEYSDNKDV
ncbi:hypothetical protein BASA50_011328 [Batrachochytrium salamandrivorans]|uniref:GSKIP domain-containing protein n=1 Tax=Batrachochytrium salamandrivorans TaxID=1357716 RepID=A0ABQ8EWB9_9FUNG|nr:hypothetical protein BASA60_007821 [Batrachochytrium salamandrivorans]KAH6587724.1 hypothetical protein BASA50_011328 [Batrachochytrium salamandrivorans]KAH6602230.1 hypothetical protein BASA61_001288 [Batrachochytrium salamandrivorans]